MGRILGIDYGDARTGIAVSDETGFLAGGIGCVNATGDSKLIAGIVDILKDYPTVERIVVGDPLNMDGTRGERSRKASDFARKLGLRTGLPVDMTDECCTTIEADEIISVSGRRGRKRKAVVDTLSAEIILQTYLDNHKSTSN